MEHEYQLVRPAFDTIVDYCMLRMWQGTLL